MKVSSFVLSWRIKVRVRTKQGVSSKHATDTAQPCPCEEPGNGRDTAARGRGSAARANSYTLTLIGSNKLNSYTLTLIGSNKLNSYTLTLIGSNKLHL